MAKLNVCVVGVGGVGGYFGGKLAHTFSSNPDSPVKIFFVARGRHLEAIKRNGLILKCPEFGIITCRPTVATERISELPQIDIFLIAVKGYDLIGAATSINKDQVKENTVILAPLNGADIHERLRHEIKTGIILPACVYLSAHIEEPGIVVHIGNLGRMIFGRDPDHPDHIPRKIFELFEKSSIDYEWKDDSNPAIWEKYIFIASFGLISARYNRTLGDILEDPSLKEEVIGIVQEICAIALKKNIGLPDGIVDLSLKKATMFPRDTQTSLTRTMGRPVNTSWRHTEGLRSPGARKGATSIFNRSFARGATAGGLGGTISRGTPGNATNQVGNTGRQNEMNFGQGKSRSFGTPNITHERSFSPQSRSFSAPQSSFGGFHGAGFSGGFHGGGFSGGQAFGGFSGGHGGGGAEAVDKNQEPIHKKRIIWSSFLSSPTSLFY